MLFFQGCGHRSSLTVESSEGEEVMESPHTHDRFRDQFTDDARRWEFKWRTVSAGALYQSQRV